MNRGTSDRVYTTVNKGIGDPVCISKPFSLNDKRVCISGLFCAYSICSKCIFHMPSNNVYQIEYFQDCNENDKTPADSIVMLIILKRKIRILDSIQSSVTLFSFVFFKKFFSIEFIRIQYNFLLRYTSLLLL